MTLTPKKIEIYFNSDRVWKLKKAVSNTLLIHINRFDNICALQSVRGYFHSDTILRLKKQPLLLGYAVKARHIVKKGRIVNELAKYFNGPKIACDVEKTQRASLLLGHMICDSCVESAD